ncbi:hypothetical protein PGT21_005215 [Puccinia graminis f. sp. tritici]|uniref:Uncharacterized protein n=1 Tax=Puccinia graminis f. sp. tritici TaxID=56615 RepID=A0A5B0RWM1_PUCGR|nr:hypothetical protein PGT21_005068 [Puccinia graminis f. sp. tritici]KAA1116224.1 hypothetical protein PGT21_005215 [Puccinia graminis f. sp. tritici]KAA1130391.1 hypothetical protein PGTUg99_010392 [Puccinia graminis f. sp. tritici]KAA1137274.1 hypothetical protein PGTUg99_015915 [Puccinia graminis f. sp. tritici]
MGTLPLTFAIVLQPPQGPLSCVLRKVWRVMSLFVRRAQCQAMPQGKFSLNIKKLQRLSSPITNHGTPTDADQCKAL